MRIDCRQRAASIALIAAMFALAACTTQPRTSSPRPERESVASAVDGARSGNARSGRAGNAEAVSERRDRASEQPADAGVEELSGIEAVLAERRRGDYPEIELQEAGFTITEQVRIGSAARTDYERAVELLRADRYDEGIALLVQVTANTPEATAPYVDLGIAYRHTGELERALEALETAALLSPENPIIQNELGIVYRQTGRFAEARASYEKALAVFDGFHFARRNLAVLCDLYLADLQCALTNYRAYLESAGQDDEVEIWVADIENRLGN